MGKMKKIVIAIGISGILFGGATVGTTVVSNFFADADRTQKHIMTLFEIGNKYKQDNKELKAKNADLQSKIDENLTIEMQVNELKNQAIQLNSQINNLNSQVTNLNKDLDNKQIELSNKDAEKAQAISEKQKEIEAKQAECDNKQRELEAKIAELESVKGLLSEKQADLDSLRNEINSLRQQIADLQVINQQVKDDNATKDERIHDLEKLAQEKVNELNDTTE